MPARRSLTLALAGILALALAAGAGAAPPTLTKRQAVRHVRIAVMEEFFNAQVTGRPRCRRVRRLRFGCRARWSDGFRRFRGKIAVYRSGLRTSPVDFYRIRAVSVSGTGRFARRQRHRARGRIVVEIRRARLGETLRLSGTNEETDIEITAGPVVDPLAPDEFEEPPTGTRYVAITIGVFNRSPLRYDDTLGSGAKLITTANTAIATAFVRRCSDTDSLSVPPREIRVGCVVFAVPFGVVLRQLEFRTNGGFGRETGVWALR